MVLDCTAVVLKTSPKSTIEALAVNETEWRNCLLTLQVTKAPSKLAQLNIKFKLNGKTERQMAFLSSPQE